MELVDVLESLEVLVFNKEMDKEEPYKILEKESYKIFNEMKDIIEGIEDEKFRKRLDSLLCEYSDAQGDLMSFSRSYGYEKGAVIGQAFQHLSINLSFDK